MKIDFKFADNTNAEVAELVDAHDSNSCALGRVGSIPTFGTIKPRHHRKAIKI